MKKREKITEHINKRAELTTTQLVTLTVLIVSFVIILILLLTLNLGKTTNEQICHNSVVLKATAGKVLSRSLNCKTNYLCISGGDSCADFSESATVNIDQVTKDAVMKAIADSMSNCWYEFGEGDFNYGSGIAQPHNDIAICSIISFDDTIQGKIPEISYQEFYNYLQNTKKDQSQTYLQYLYEISSVDQFTPQPRITVDITKDKILTNTKYSVITGIANNGANVNEVIFKVYLIPTSELNTRITPPNLGTENQFVTTA